MSSYTVLVKLANGGNHKLTFPKKPSVKDIKAEVHKQAGLAPELDVVLSAEDADFGTWVVLGSDGDIKDKMVLTGETKIKVSQLHSGEQRAGRSAAVETLPRTACDLPHATMCALLNSMPGRHIAHQGSCQQSVHSLMPCAHAMHACRRCIPGTRWTARSAAKLC
jgi:hypothetical protein